MSSKKIIAFKLIFFVAPPKGFLGGWLILNQIDLSIGDTFFWVLVVFETVLCLCLPM